MIKEMRYSLRSKLLRIILLIAIAFASLYFVQTIVDGSAGVFLKTAAEDPEGAIRYVSETAARELPSAVIGGGLTMWMPVVGILAGSGIEGGAHLSNAAHNSITGNRQDVPASIFFKSLFLSVLLCLFAYSVGQALVPCAAEDRIFKRLSYGGMAFVLIFLTCALFSAEHPLMIGAIAAASFFKSTKVERSSDLVANAT